MLGEDAETAARIVEATVDEPSDEHSRSMAVATKAIGQIKALRLPATPRNYEIWYAYATGHYPSLNHTINDLLARRVVLGDATLEQIGGQFVAASGIQDRIDNVGARVAGAIGQILAAMDVSIVAEGAHSEGLSQAADTLAAIRDREAMRAVIERMVLAAKEIKGDRHRLEARLQASGAEIDQLRKELKTIRTESLLDPVTGLVNRKAVEPSLKKAIRQAAERGEPLALMMADIDNFKGLNDSWGHLIGDQVLRLVASELKRTVPGQHNVARFGGDEFMVVLPKATVAAACAIADQIRRSIMSRDIVTRSTGQNLGRITVSFGIAAVKPGDTTETLFARADACLYEAKCHGRNRVIGEADPELSDAGPTAAVA